MDITEIKTLIDSWDEMLSFNMKKFIHYRSMRNFVLHYDEIEDQNAKRRILSLLNDYLEEVQANSYDYDAASSYDFARKYLSKLTDYYKQYSHFVGFLRIRMVFLYGVLGDSLLYISGIPSHYWNIPIVTSVLLLYYTYVVLFKEPKGRVCGLYY